jgi:hypothetical protein
MRSVRLDAESWRLARGRPTPLRLFAAQGTGGVGADGYSGQNKRRDQIREGHRNPHQRAGERLVFHPREAEALVFGQVWTVHGVATKREKCGKRVARQRCNKEINRRQPVRTQAAPRRVDHRPPRQSSCNENAGVLKLVPGMRSQRQLKL